MHISIVESGVYVDVWVCVTKKNDVSGQTGIQF